MQIGFIGLGKMGGNMVHRIKRASDHEVVVFDFSAGAVHAAEDHGALGAGSLEELVGRLYPPRTVWIMVPAGDPTQKTIDALLGLSSEGDTIVDGGNSKWTESIARHAQCAEHGVAFVDVGTSGGVWGLDVGYCMMVGGDEEPIARLAPVLDVLAPRAPAAEPDAEPVIGWARMGAAGSGHYVKMVHNGIEYSLMQGYAEGFELMHKSEYGLDVEQIANLWGTGSVVRSWLLELLARAYAEDGTELEGVGAWVEDSGEGRWTLESGIAHDVPMPALAASLFVRFVSRGDGEYTARLLAALRNQFGGHVVKKA